MPFPGCCASGVLVSALVTLLLLPVQYYVPDFRADKQSAPPPAPPAPAPPAPRLDRSWLTFDHFYFPTLDLVFTFTLLVLGVLIYLCEWIQRKLMERRIIKLNQLLGASVERLRAWDVQQAQLEATLRLVRSAAAEYSLLLCLLLRRPRCPAASAVPATHNCFYEKDLQDQPIF